MKKGFVMERDNVIEWQCAPSWFPASPTVPYKSLYLPLPHVWWAAQQHIHCSGPGETLTQCHSPAGDSRSNREGWRWQKFARKTSLHGVVFVINPLSPGTSSAPLLSLRVCSFFIHHSISRIVILLVQSHQQTQRELGVREKLIPAFTSCRSDTNPLRKFAFSTCDMRHPREFPCGASREYQVLCMRWKGKVWNTSVLWLVGLPKAVWPLSSPRVGHAEDSSL